MRTAPAVLPLCLSLLLAASPLRGQSPERSDRFRVPIRGAAEVSTAFAGSLPVRLEPSRAPAIVDPGDSREGFALLLGAVMGGLAGVWVGCAGGDCTGDWIGPPPAALRGLLIGIPVGAGLTFSAVRAERPR